MNPEIPPNAPEVMRDTIKEMLSTQLKGATRAQQKATLDIMAETMRLMNPEMARMFEQAAAEVMAADPSL